jgi:hypothetical protein
MKFTTNLFGQILQITPRLDFYNLARKYGVECNAKGFSSWDQYVAMLFCQLAQAKSLREISDGLAATCGKLNHPGTQTAPGKRRSLMLMAIDPGSSIKIYSSH